MAIFTVRVELHNASEADCQRLNAAMIEAGYRREVTADDGGVFQLPDGEFDLVAQGTATQVMEHAHRIAIGVKIAPAPSILVTEAKVRAWNLPLVRRKSGARSPSPGPAAR
jgi:hypothetical protein